MKNSPVMALILMNMTVLARMAADGITVVFMRYQALRQ
jgi:hypothetical protein